MSAFNNAGFALFSDNLIGFAADPWICLPIAAAVIIGGLGFPVLFELRRRLRRPRRWSLHTRITVGMTVVLLVAGTRVPAAGGVGQPRHARPARPDGRLLAGFFNAAMPRTAGFNSLDLGQLEPGTLLGTDVLMFIGGGRAGTAGGIKVTTFALLLFVIWAEMRGEPEVTRPGPPDRAAGLAPGPDRRAVSRRRRGDRPPSCCWRSRTIGLRRGAVRDGVRVRHRGAVHRHHRRTCRPAGQLVLVALMFIGRLGPITLVSALALRERHRLFHLPEGRPLIG